MPLSAADRLAIHELIALHGHVMDSGRLDRFEEVFTDDVRYDLTAVRGGVLTGPDAIREATLALGDRNPLAHLVTNTVVEETPDGVRAVSKYLGLSTEGAVGSGVYEDELRLTAEGWRIAARRVVPRRRPLQP